MDIDDIKQDLEKYWPDAWQNIVDIYEKREKLFTKIPLNGQQKIGTPKEQLVKRIESHKLLKQYEQDVLNTIIPKEQLEDGIWYLALEGSHNLCRHISRARWDKSKDMFWYVRTKFKQTFEDTMHHFADTYDIGYAGFTPIKKETDGD